MGILQNIFGRSRRDDAESRPTQLGVSPNPIVAGAQRRSSEIASVCWGCQTDLVCPISIIDDVVGAHRECHRCQTITHIPAVYKTSVEPYPPLSVFVRLPISNFRSWGNQHPCWVLQDPEELAFYGLFAFCGSCDHRYKNSVLVSYLVSFSDRIVFGAKSAASAKDFEGLRERKCPACGNSTLRVLITEVPENVRQWLASQRAL